MLDELCYVYALCDPLTGDIRYIGTSQSVKTRYLQHLYKSKQCLSHKGSPLNDWINLLGIYGYKPKLKILHKTDYLKRYMDEYKFIKKHEKNGKLLNLVLTKDFDKEKYNISMYPSLFLRLYNHFSKTKRK